MDAQLSFPGRSSKSLRICEPARRPLSPICQHRRASQCFSRVLPLDQTHVVDVVQGTGPRGLLVTLYFDRQSGLLLRELRMAAHPSAAFLRKLTLPIIATSTESSSRSE